MEVGVGIIGLGNVGKGTIEILHQNASCIREKLGFALTVKAVCSRSLEPSGFPELDSTVLRTNKWRDVVCDPSVDVVVEAIGGMSSASQIITEALGTHKSVVTANKE